jgi:hypothetical protein
MSWKQYGGINKLDTLNNINLNTLSVESFRMHKPYNGNFDICGNLTINGSQTISNDLNVRGTITSNGVNFDDLTLEGNLIVDTNADFNGNIYMHYNAYITDSIIMDQSNTTFLHSDNGNLGLNIYHPTATLDICGNSISSLNVYSNQDKTKNILSRNRTNKGIVFNTDLSSSSIEFYTDSSINITSPNTYSARIQSNQTGLMTIDVSDTVQVISNMSIGDRSNIRNPNLETVSIYDNSYGVLHYPVYNSNVAVSGNALT